VGADVPAADHRALSDEVRALVASLVPKPTGAVAPAAMLRAMETRPAPGGSAIGPTHASPAASAAEADDEEETNEHPAWPPPRPFGTRDGKPVGKLAMGGANPPPPRKPAANLKETQRVQASAVHTPPPHTATPPGPPAVLVPPPMKPAEREALGITQMKVEAPIAAAPRPDASSLDTKLPSVAPSSSGFDALALAESAVPTNAAAPPAPPPIDIPTYTPSVPPSASPQIPTMDELMRAPPEGGALLASAPTLQPPRKSRAMLWALFVALFAVSAVGGAGVFLYVRGDLGPHPPAPVASESENSEDEPPPPKKKPKKSGDDDDDAKSGSSASASATGTSSAKPSAAPSSSASAAPTPSTSASGAKVVATIASGPKPDGKTALLRTPPAGSGRRVFVDGKVVGEGPGPLVVPCGTHSIKVGSSGKVQTVDVPCGGDILVPAL
jgi:hypothetical protein